MVSMAPEVHENMNELIDIVAGLRSEMTDMQQDLEEKTEGNKQEIRDLKKEVDSLGSMIANVFNWVKGKFVGGKKEQSLGGKGVVPPKLTGRGEESFRTWSQDLKAYCNGVYKGFRKALVWAESRSDAIDAAALANIQWKPLGTPTRSSTTSK